MKEPQRGGESERIMTVWSMLELFSPQQLPQKPSRTRRGDEPRVIDWTSNNPLPWEELTSPPPSQYGPSVWQHTVYLGVYELADTYDYLHRVFRDNRDAYRERPGQESACAGLLLDERGCYLSGSAVLSSGLWAVGRIEDPGPDDPRWAEGFTEAAQRFAEALEENENARCEEHDDTELIPHDQSSLEKLLSIAHAAAGIQGIQKLATTSIRIKSTLVRENRSDDAKSLDFLNSFYLDDLEMVQRAMSGGERPGSALAAYLTPEGTVDISGRVDVLRSPEAVDDGVVLDRLPWGRWPAELNEHLALSQQFAVNRAVNDLASTRGIMGVNGPPGTGKTTMLRDILAGLVVERARRLSRLDKAEYAFVDEGEEVKWFSPDGPRCTVRPLKPEFTGFEMVLASSNNGAVENVSAEIPVRKALAERWRKDADYFADIATMALSQNSKRHGNDDEDAQAWGLISAVLGNKRNRSEFRSAFWFGGPKPRSHNGDTQKIESLQDQLKKWKADPNSHISWEEACERYRKAEQHVQDLITERSHAEKRLRALPRLMQQAVAQDAAVTLARADLDALTEQLDAQKQVEAEAREHLKHVKSRYDRHKATKPGILENIFSLGKVGRQWRSDLAARTAELCQAEDHAEKQRQQRQDLQRCVHQQHRIYEAAEEERERIGKALHDLRVQCAADRTRYRGSYPGELSGPQREIRAPWLDEELDEARSQLFFAALDLHRDFLANAASIMVEGLRAAADVLVGKYPQNLEPEKLLAAWQLFFLAVPLVSTTFASFSRMFGRLGKEAIGWLLIDEAGQASPQCAVGAIWRAQRVVAVGDPLQLQPVVTIPSKVQHDIAATYGVAPLWLPPRASVQTLTDRVSPFGATLDHDGESVWVSSPLRVHHRCDEPMFSLCNDMAYSGMMIRRASFTPHPHHEHEVVNEPDQPAKPEQSDKKNDSELPRSYWLNEPEKSPGSHLQTNQVDRLKGALSWLAGEKGLVKQSDIIVITPFREVAGKLRECLEGYPNVHAGTIHTVQGKAALVVILMLACDPDKPGAKSWAASSVNLLNVAVSRAKQRLYVIGDHASWSQHRYFQQLARAIPLWEEFRTPENPEPEPQD
ncbi:DEAD/DEAH box helicase [Devriesea agamarum]|uniref:DEAD/DEAH box helicase n=1 Tax=Devriesea agamarum TaxID=472569 RepID=UPI00071C92DD|nr:ATP-binding protein [Devriesea agamarum]